MGNCCTWLRWGPRVEPHRRAAMARPPRAHMRPAPSNLVNPPPPTGEQLTWSGAWQVASIS
jgi:hypothetical protein